MKLSREEVIHIAALARVGFTEEDLEKFREQLSNILENFEVLKQIDTSNVKPTATVTDIQNVMRPDEVIPSLPVDDVLANAPRREGEFFRVKAVLETE
jgi:aspartyl-tRNA(Asn)/glutamyl-tRNA(Gln) amidotransferase subunit C